jgi:hypothetical protein
MHSDLQSQGFNASTFTMQWLFQPLQRISSAQSLSRGSRVLRLPRAMVMMAFGPSSLISGNASTIGANPIVFAASGLKPDVRIKVFEQEFHVHSVVLRLHSAFFRKLIDVEDRVSSYSETFRYDYISCVDVGGGWGLEVATEVRQVHNNSEWHELSPSGGSKIRRRDLERALGFRERRRSVSKGPMCLVQ